MPERKNEAMQDINLYNYIKDNKEYADKWTTKKVKNINIQSVLDKSSKKGTDNRGEPDLIYVNENKRLLILIENKDLIRDHASADTISFVTMFAVDGIKHYLSYFTKEKLSLQPETVKKYFETWNIIGLAVSGDMNDEYNRLIDTFIISSNNIIDIDVKEILNEEEYLAFFENIDLELIATNISKSSSEINIKLRQLDSQKRPVILSALMICLYEKNDFKNDFKRSYNLDSIDTIISNIPITVKKILKKEGISDDKTKILINLLSFLEDDNDLKRTNVLKEILNELENNVLPLFNKKTNYDIIGKFYEEFLSYAGITNVKKGIVLTPNHITKLFTELVPIKTNDVIFDPCCGTGAFLIAGMNKLIAEINNSDIENKTDKIKHIKENQLIGFEYNSTMYSLAISNMLFRGDGKSRIFYTDFFKADKEPEAILKGLKTEKDNNPILPTIGFINPPYSGKDNQKDPTKKEIQFIEKTLDIVSRFCVVIAPLSTFFKDDPIRNRILSKHTLKCVINMPSDLFEPNASTHTAIAVFETNIPHNNKNVVLYDLINDGFILSKQKGRTDVLNKWEKIKKNMFEKLNDVKKYQDDLTLLSVPIKKNDEWIIQAHSKTDYSKLYKKDFIQSIKEYSIFLLKLKLNLFEAKMDEISFAEILNDNGIMKGDAILNHQINFSDMPHKEFDIEGKNGIFNIRGSNKSFTQYQVKPGEYLYITTSNKNNAVSGTSNIYTEQGNVLTFDSATDGKCFYQPFHFIGSDHLEILESKKIILNKYIGMYLITILNLEMFRYSFGRKRAQKRMKIGKIYLPHKYNEKLKKDMPDYQFMEDYIKSLPYSTSI